MQTNMKAVQTLATRGQRDLALAYLGHRRGPAPAPARTSMSGVVADPRPQTEQHADRSSLAERNERARIERLRADAKRPPGELLEETLRLSKFLTGLADSARRDGDL